jgi:peptide/nickel transport system substrate-binding protein
MGKWALISGALLLGGGALGLGSQLPAFSPQAAYAQEEDPSLDRSGEGGTLVIGMSAGNVPFPNTPPNEGAEGRRFVGNMIYDSLTKLNEDQGDEVPTPQPWLAKSWEISEDQLTWTFQLEEGVMFHDGTPFNAEAVVFALDRTTNQEFEYFDSALYGASRQFTQAIESYRAVDEYTLEITTFEPFSFLLWSLAFTLLPSPTAVMEYGNEEYVNHASGTGPFRMVRYVDGEVIEFEANEDYWRGRPKLDRIVAVPMPEPSSRVAALLSGDIDWAEVPPPDSLPQLEGQDYNVLLREYPHSIILGLNTYREPFDDIRVRQALQYAIDRDSMCNILLNGVCTAAHQFLYEGHPWYDPEFGDRYRFDPEKARELLAEAGYEDNLTIRIAYPTGGSGNMYPGPMMELMQANFREIGVTMEIFPLEWNSILTLYRTGFGAPENDQYDGFYFSPNTQTPLFITNFDTNRTPPNGCCNSYGYSSEVVDDLFQRAALEFEPDAQNALLQEAMGQVAEDSPVIFVVHDLNLRVLSPDVRGFIQPKSWTADFLNVWVRD